MPGFDRISSPDGVGELKPVTDAHVLQKEKGRFCPVVNKPVQLFLLLNHADSFRGQLVENLRASMNYDFMNDQLLVGRIEVEGEPGIRLDPRRGKEFLSYMDE